MYCNDQKLSILPTDSFCVFYSWQNKYLLHVLPKRLVFIMDTDCVFCWRRELKLYESIKLKSICRVLVDVYSQPHQSNIRFTYRVIHKSLRDFRPLRYSSRDGHAEGEHVNRGTDTLNFCPTLQVLNISTLGDAADVNHVFKFLPLTLHARGSMSTEGETLQVSVLLFMCSISPPLVTRQMSIL